MPPWTGITCPSSDDPAPNAVIGHAVSAQAATIACTSAVDVGKTTASGTTACVMRFAAAMVIADGGAGGQAVAEQIAQPREQRPRTSFTGTGGDLLDQVLGEREADRAGLVVDAALGERESAAAGAVLRVERLQHRRAGVRA